MLATEEAPSNGINSNVFANIPSKDANFNPNLNSTQNLNPNLNRSIFDDRNITKTDKMTTSGLNFNYNLPLNSNLNNNKLPVYDPTLIKSFSSGKSIGADIPKSPKMDNISTTALLNGPPLGTLLNTPKDSTPTKISFKNDTVPLTDSSKAPTTVSNLPSMNLPSVPTIPKIAQPIVKEDIKVLNEKVNNIISQHSKSIPFQQSQQSGGTTLADTIPAHIPIATATALGSIGNENIAPVSQVQSNQHPTHLTQQQQPELLREQAKLYQEQAQQQFKMYQELQREQIRQQNEFLQREQEEKQQKAILQDYSNPNTIYTMEQEAKIRADYRVKFSILRDAYPKMNIPEPGSLVPIYLIELEYRQYIKKIHIDSSVEQNKLYLLIAWLIIEIGGSKLFGIPFSGYTENQFRYMNK
jgi:hypothetical protein